MFSKVELIILECEISYIPKTSQNLKAVLDTILARKRGEGGRDRSLGFRLKPRVVDNFFLSVSVTEGKAAEQAVSTNPTVQFSQFSCSRSVSDKNHALKRVVFEHFSAGK